MNIYIIASGRSSSLLQSSPLDLIRLTCVVQQLAGHPVTHTLRFVDRCYYIDVHEWTDDYVSISVDWIIRSG